eukprot:1159144-Pelagomonas_calceolata.AAC.14
MRGSACSCAGDSGRPPGDCAFEVHRTLCSTAGVDPVSSPTKVALGPFISALLNFLFDFLGGQGLPCERNVVCLTKGHEWSGKPAGREEELWFVNP